LALLKPKGNNVFNIEENLKKLPDSPGVYLHKDKLGHVIYVGKANSLKSRVRQYFQSSRNMDSKVKAMVSNIAEFEYITTGSEMEALILECNLIKKYMPKYNVLLRDDKTYPYIKITTTELFPRILKTRNVGKEGDKYFGPYSDAGAVNQMVDLLNKVYRLKRCSPVKFPNNATPCLNYHIHQCDGICIGKADQLEYRDRIDSAMDFLKGKNKNLTSHLKEKMMAAASEMNYEEAARYRDFILAATAIHEKQRVVLTDTHEIDVVLVADSRHIVVFYVREGKLSGRDHFDLENPSDSATDEALDKAFILSAFLKQHYGSQGIGPAEIIVEREPEDQVLLESFLQNSWGRRVKILIPQKGEKKALLELTKSDVAQFRKNLEDREKNRLERENDSFIEVTSLLQRMRGCQEQNLPPEKVDAITKPQDSVVEPVKKYRLEAYDLSNTNGLEAVGAMVVFRGSIPEKKAYRRFKIRTVDGPDDYASLQEILYRRLKRGQEGDPGFVELPDLLLMDGGIGHVHAALTVLSAMGISIPVAGMVKDDKHKTRGLVYECDGKSIEENLSKRPALFKLMGTIQEEVHRFAIDYHRSKRDQKNLGSVLDRIEGIGPNRRNALLAHFGSVENIKNADLAALREVPGISESQAKRIREYFI
jgi:excinuclease ABC subunit C